MNLPFPARTLILWGVALLLFVLLITQWIGHWGLVTIHENNAPLGKVIASIARQGHLRIESSLDPIKTVSLDLDHVPAIEALDALAIRADASWRLVYLAAPTKSELTASLLSLKADGKVDDWTTYFYPIPFGAESTAGIIADPRDSTISLEGDDLSLSRLLNQAAQKAGVMTLFPKDWSPALAQLPKPHQVGKTIADMVHAVHGKTDEFFFLTERGDRRRPQGEAPPTQAPAQEQAAQPEMNPDWMEQRQLAQISKLPPEKQAEAKQEIRDHKALVAEMQKLSPEERKAKMQVMMSDPDRVEKFVDRMLLRDSKLSAQQRINRAVRYLNRKAAAQAAQ